MKFLRSLPAEWNTHVVVWRNKADLDTMSIDDLYKNFKIVEQEVKRTVTSSSRSGSQNIAFLLSPGSTNEADTANIQVSTVSTPVSTVTKGNRVTSAVGKQGINAAKSSVCWVWRPKIKGDPQDAIKDTWIFHSRYSRHMTGNKSYLTNYQEYDGGFVAYAGSSKGGKITRKMCDKKNSVLFTETECLILSPDFKLPDKSQKRKQHKASCKSKVVNSTSQPLQILHMNLFGPTLIKSFMGKMYCLVVTDDYSRFSLVFFLAKKDESSGIHKDFIIAIENQLNHKVKIIRCDNGIKFKSYEMNQFYGIKRIKREFDNARTLQQNGVAERKNMTLIGPARTMLAYSVTPSKICRSRNMYRECYRHTYATTHSSLRLSLLRDFLYNAFIPVPHHTTLPSSPHIYTTSDPPPFTHTHHLLSILSVTTTDTLPSSSLSSSHHHYHSHHHHIARHMMRLIVGGYSRIWCVWPAVNSPEMDLESAQNNVVAKLPLLKQGDYEMWKLRIKQYFQLQDYALWDVIENVNSFNPVPRTTANADGTSTSTIPAIQARFGGNDAIKKTQKTLLKQMYETFNAPSTESLDSIFKRLQRIVSQLPILDLDTMSIDDLYNNFKIVEQEVKRTVISSSRSGSQNMAFLSSPGSLIKLILLIFNAKVNSINTAKGNRVTNAVGKQGINAAKSSACWVWRPKIKGDPQDALKDTGIFHSSSKGGKITKKDKIRTGKLDFEDVYFVKELKFNLFSVSQMCDKKNSVLFTKTECLILSPNFKLPDKSHVLLKVPRKNNMYSFDLNNVVPSKGLTFLFVKATNNVSNLYHKRLGHINFKTMNKLVKGILVSSLPSKILKMTTHVLLVKKESNTKPLFCGIKRIKREFNNVRTLQQNGVAERKNRTLIEAARTMLAKAVNTTCYVQNSVLVTKPHNKTPYELLIDRTPIINFMRPFSCLVTIHNTFDHDGKADEGFLVGYSINSKGFRVYNSRTRKIEENLYVNFLEKKPNAAGSGLEWLFDIDSLINSINYQPISTGNRTNGNACLEIYSDAGQIKKEKVPDQEYILLPLLNTCSDVPSSHEEVECSPKDDAGNKLTVEPTCVKRGKTDDLECLDQQMKSTDDSKTLTVLIVLIFHPAALDDYSKMTNFEDTDIFDDAYDDRDEGAEADYNLKEVYVSQPSGFVDLEFPDRVYKVEKALYGLHQAPRAWYETLSTYLLENGFRRGIIDKTLFIKKIKNDILLAQVVKSASTPMETHKPLTKNADGIDVNVHLYRSMISSLMYLTSSRPEIMFDVCACSRFQVQPKVSHMHAMKRIFRNLKGQPTLGLWYPKDSPLELIAYFDSDYLGASLDRKSTTGGCQFLGSRLISWQCKKHTIMANSTIEAEYITASNCYGHVIWLQNQLLDYGYNFLQKKIHVDNESAICVVKNHVYHSKTKNIEIRHHFIRDSYKKTLIQMVKKHTDYNIADLFTKAFDVTRFKFLIATIDKKELAIPGQTATGKEFSNPLMDGSLPKTIESFSSINIFMDDLKFVDQHNMVAYLEKSDDNTEFHQIVDFLSSYTIIYAHTVSPTIYASYIEQFWNTASSKTINSMKQIHATGDSKAIVISESSVRSDLLFDDEDGEPKKDTELPQTSVPLNFRADEAVHKEGSQAPDTMGGTSAQTRSKRVLKQPNEPPLLEGLTSRSGDGIMEHTVELTDTVPPTPHDLPLTGGYTPESDKGRLKLEELINIYTIVSNKVTTLENDHSSTRAVYHKAFITLTKRVKMLETQLKQKRCRAVIHSSNKEEPGLDVVDSPKQGMMIKELDKDKDVNLVREQGEGGYKQSHFKGMKYEDIRPTFERAQRSKSQMSRQRRKLKLNVIMIKRSVERNVLSALQAYNETTKEEMKCLVESFEFRRLNSRNLMISSRAGASSNCARISPLLTRRRAVWKTFNELHAMLKLYEQTLTKKDPAVHQKKSQVKLGLCSSKKYIENLQYNGFLNSNDLMAFEKYVPCMSGKTARKPYSHQVERAKDLLGLIHTDETIGYSFYYPPKNKVLVAQNAKFLKNSLITQEVNGSLEDLKIILEEDMYPSLDTSVHHEEGDLEINEPQSDIIPIRRSIRTRHAPDLMCLYIDAEDHELGDLGEPANYKAALLNTKSDKWLDAMNVEMQSMKDNEVCDLVKLLPDGKTVGSKWLYKKKTNIDGAVHTYKARLVTKVYTQTLWIDYEETLSHIANI
nr:hypothetical protein [Tanacetum cinerariifolium]